MRRVAVVAIATLGSRVDAVRAAAIDAVERALDDESHLVRIAANAAAEKLGDARLLPKLDRLRESETDGRLRRDAAEAAIRIREAQSKPEQLAGLREDVDKLRIAMAALRDRVDTSQP